MKKLSFMFTLAVLLLGCGGGSDSPGTGNAGSGGTSNGGAGAGGAGAAGAAAGAPAPPPSSVDASKHLPDATEADLAAICDWFASLVGGYGAPATCSTAILAAPLSLGDCEASFPMCDVPFSDFEACVSAITQAQAACTDTSVADARASDACAPVVAADCFPTP
jgi:hypothetical protein